MDPIDRESSFTAISLGGVTQDHNVLSQVMRVEQQLRLLGSLIISCASNS
jgi:hypothetical protein